MMFAVFAPGGPAGSEIFLNSFLIALELRPDLCGPWGGTPAPSGLVVRENHGRAGFFLILIILVVIILPVNVSF
jgi:hypothetical protein